MVSNDYLSRAPSFVRERVMFHKLKQCKTLREIYEVLGNTMFYTTPYFYMFLAFAAGRGKNSSQAASVKAFFLDFSNSSL